MGEQNVPESVSAESRRKFMRSLLDDIDALKKLIEGGGIESGIRRVGAELEMFLIDRARRPAPIAMEVLARADDARLTTELARFNVEANTAPQIFGGGCLSLLERELSELVQKVRRAAEAENADVILTGILPTLELADLSLANMSPKPRYFALNEAMKRLQRGGFRVHIKGLDELDVTHDNVMLESCNTSFQIHFQAGAEEFAQLYNLAQAVTAPVLAAAVNSPTLLGQRLWHETRVALFQQSIDARSSAQMMRGARPRVTFGEQWLDDSVIEIFREDVARFHVVLADAEETGELPEDGLPRLAALRLHNGTVYRWNRPCYGIHDGKAHLRVENRVLPAGPTIIDQVANAAFYYGLMAAMQDEYGRIEEKMDFDDAKANFFAAARHGLQAQFTWVHGRTYTAGSLILDHLLPLAREGLKKQSVLPQDIERYLTVLEDRVKSGRTGSQWMHVSLAGMAGRGTRDTRLRTLTGAILARQKQGDPVHTWELATLDEQEDWRDSYQTVGQMMTRDLYTIGPEDLVDLAASVMDWQGIHYMPVEDEDGIIVGLLTQNHVLRMVGKGRSKEDAVAVKDVMQTDFVTCAPSCTSLEALKAMRDNPVKCLPVVDAERRLLGIITEADFLDAAAVLMESELTKGES